MKKENYYKVIALLIPRIEQVLNYNITYYEKCILIKQHIEDWRK